MAGPRRPRRPAGLADFDNPPLTEVALSIQYEALTPFQFVDLAPLWQELRRRYPKVEQQPQLPADFEIFGVPTQIEPRMIQLSPAPTMPRFWFVGKPSPLVMKCVNAAPPIIRACWQAAL